LQPLPSALRETAVTVAASIAKGGGVAAVADGTIIGALLWEDRDGGLYFGRMSVASGWRRKGVAQAMIGVAEAHARATGAPRIHAAVRLALTGNRALFASLGFVETQLHAHEGYTAPTWVDLEKRFG
jgi:GNAT superfamily N-acetyltransferase